MSDAPLHTLLGAGGSVGTPLMNELLARRARVRLVSRRGLSHPGTESSRADLTRRDETIEAVRGSSGAYLLAGLFNADVGESGEMLYQNEGAHLFDSSKITREVGIAPTRYPEGIRATIAWLRRR